MGNGLGEEDGLGETADVLWRGEVNVMGGSAVYEVMNDDDGGDDHSAHRHTDRHTDT